ncbi:MAG: 16S rRNA (cytosine(967)-C(5))-methyltransferase RsmB, partial [Clostridia bacterium]|nr:16S rRNA (cytosine(967)-C(5))-methyltransferase RsmB [Clostridia bacterium]
TGIVRAFDIYQSRVELIRNGASRLGLSNVFSYLSDASIFNENYGLADRVLCDVPCSGTGIIRRKPEIKYKAKEALEDLPEIQYSILVNGAQYVKEGGRLIYSTCALSKEENEGVCNRFLSVNSDFSAVNPLPEISSDPFITLMPHINSSDGFFIACFERKSD